MASLDFSQKHPFLTSQNYSNETKNDMKLRHRKELKQLTADIKLYTKNSSFSKADLKSWLSELQEIHASQMKQFETPEEEILPEEPKVDVTATRQYRRAVNKAAKKALEMEEIENDIAQLAMQENTKEKELEKILSNLPENYTVREMPPDGACLFYSIASQLRDCNASELRKRMIDFMSEKFDDFAYFAGATNREEYDQYLKKMSCESSWGGDIEIAAISQMLDKAITVYFSDQKERRYGSLDGDDIKVSYHRYWLASGNHYNAVLTTK